MELFNSRLLTFAVLERKAKTCFSPLKAAKHGFYLSKDTTDLKCYRCQNTLKISDFTSHVESERVINGHSSNQCVIISNLAQNQTATECGTCQEDNLNKTQSQTQLPKGDCEGDNNDNTTVSNADLSKEFRFARKKCDTKLVDSAVSLGFDLDFICDALLDAELDFVTTPDLVNYLIHVELVRDKETLPLDRSVLNGYDRGHTLSHTASDKPRKKKQFTRYERDRWNRRRGRKKRITSNNPEQHTEHNPHVLSLLEELRRLEDEFECKLCCSETTETVLIPCGHILMCKLCTISQTNCPLCRTNILSVVVINTEQTAE